jgi:phosphotriesterase-related protein
MSDVGLAQLAVFESEGADLSRVVIGHADSYPHLEHYLEIIRRGASVEFDFLGMSFTPQERVGEPRLIELLLELLSRGHAHRLFLSQDVCHNAQLCTTAVAGTPTSRTLSCPASASAACPRPRSSS